jgi:hypothetical protein
MGERDAAVFAEPGEATADEPAAAAVRDCRDDRPVCSQVPDSAAACGVEKRDRTVVRAVARECSTRELRQAKEKQDTTEPVPHAGPTLAQGPRVPTRSSCMKGRRRESKTGR